MIVLVTASFGFVAALAWNDAIKALINLYVPKGDALTYLFMYAMLVTLIGIIIISIITKYLKPK
jgi:hypothetical protein